MIFNEMVDIILDLRNRRALAPAKRSFDKKEIMRLSYLTDFVRGSLVTII